MSERRAGDPLAAELLATYITTFGDAALPVAVERIAEDLLGLRVHVRPGLGVSGMIIPVDRLVVLNGDEPEPRRRFTMAHELGHWVRHCGEPMAAPVMCRAVRPEAVGDLRERAANVFAADLLMPEEAVRAAQESDEAALAARFAVSPDAMAWRLYNLGLRQRPGDRVGHDPAAGGLG